MFLCFVDDESSISFGCSRLYFNIRSCKALQLSQLFQGKIEFSQRILLLKCMKREDMRSIGQNWIWNERDLCIIDENLDWHLRYASISLNSGSLVLLENVPFQSAENVPFQLINYPLIDAYCPLIVCSRYVVVRRCSDLCAFDRMHCLIWIKFCEAWKRIFVHHKHLLYYHRKWKSLANCSGRNESISL